MPEILPASRKSAKHDVYDMLVLWPLEAVTKSLRRGDTDHSLETLRPLAQRCRALADAFDARITEMGGKQ